MKYWVGKSTTTRIFNLPISLYAKLRGNLYFQKKLDKIERTFSWEDSDNVSRFLFGEVIIGNCQ